MRYIGNDIVEHFAAKRRACSYAASCIERILADGGLHDDSKSAAWNGFEASQWDKLARELSHRGGWLSDSEVSTTPPDAAESAFARATREFLGRISRKPQLALPPGKSLG